MIDFRLKKKPKDTALQLDSSQNPKVLEVNLIKDEIQVDFDINKNIGTLLFSLLIAALFMAEVYLGLNWWSNYESARVEEMETKFNQVSKEIKGLKGESEKILAFKQRADLVDSLVANHVYWTKFFNWLEKNTLSSVNYLGFEGDDSGVYSLQASAKTYRDLSWQTRALLEDPSVVSANVAGGESERPKDEGQAEAAVEDITFTLDLTVDPALFKNLPAN